jgi:O-antigen/teichoic acid export membrane protein
MFQGLGNTKPAMLSTATRLAVFVPLAVWLSKQPGFHLPQVWYLSVATVWMQGFVSFALLRQQFRKRLAPVAAGAPAAAAARVAAGPSVAAGASVAAGGPPVAASAAAAEG